MPVWPDWTRWRADRAVLDNAPYRKLYDYPATVRWAAGAFNWRVQAGDVVHVYEFENGQTRLAAERSARRADLVALHARWPPTSCAPGSATS